MTKLNLNQVVIVQGFIGFVKNAFDGYSEITFNFHGKIITHFFKNSEIKVVSEKAKYTKDEQFQMFGRVFSNGFISIRLDNFDHVNAWDHNGLAMILRSAKQVGIVNIQA